jgi:hypothetical protein
MFVTAITLLNISVLFWGFFLMRFKAKITNFAGYLCGGSGAFLMAT